MDLTIPVVTRLVADLERHLGARLLNRTTRRLSLTEAGSEYHQHCRRILEEIDEVESRLHARSGAFSGVVRLLGGTSARAFIVPVLAEYRRRYPSVTLEFSFGTSGAGLIEEGYDLAILPEELGMPATLVARPLVTGPQILCAAPGYLVAHGEPQTPADLAGHDCLSYTHESIARAMWRLDRGGESFEVPVRGVLSSNNIDVLRLAATEGGGIGTAARPLIADELRNGSLVQVLPDYCAGQVAWHLMYPGRKFVAAKVRALIDMLVEAAARLQQDIDFTLGAARGKDGGGLAAP